MPVHKNKQAICIWGLLILSGASTGLGKDSSGEPPQRPHEGPAPIAVFPRSANEDPNKDPKRHAIGQRFKFPGRAITELPAGVEPGATFTHELVGLPALPVASSDVIALGRVISARAYLGPDHTSVYSEFTVGVEAILKQDSGLSGRSSRLIVYRNGGSVLFPSGRMHHYRAVDVGLPEAGSRYVLFLKRMDDAGLGPLRILTGYQLTRLGVKPLDGPPPFAAYAGLPEKEFLGAVRTAVKAMASIPAR
jgi:hypothetical protein